MDVLTKVITQGRIFSALSLFVEVPTSFTEFNFGRYPFYSTVGVVSSTKAYFELGDILNERFR